MARQVFPNHRKALLPLEIYSTTSNRLANFILEMKMSTTIGSRQVALCAGLQTVLDAPTKRPGTRKNKP
jgi:hypothetical protein